MCFGDSFLIRDDKSGLLVDCGSKNQGPTRKRYMGNLITSHLNRLDSKRLLITHYHADHINTLFNLFANGITFDEIYVRDLSRNRLKFDFSSAVSNLTIYAKITGDYKSYLAWLRPRKLKTILSKGGTVYGVNNTNRRTVRIGKTTANILWPSPNVDVQPDLSKKIKEVGEKLFDSICFDENNKVVKLIKKLYSFFDELIEEAENEEAINEKTIDYILDKYEDDEFPSDEEIDDYLKRIDTTKKEFKEASDLENKLSIVFEIDSKLLMCGDADNDAMDCALKKHNDNSEGKDTIFALIKVPHHGTEDYYYSKLPCDDETIYLIPNSKQRQGTGWSIFDQYTCAAAPKVRYCYSLNNSATTACPTAKSGKCRFPYFHGILDFLIFPF